MVRKIAGQLQTTNVFMWGWAGTGRVDRDADGAGAARTALFAAIKNLHKYTQREHRQINFGL